MNKKSIFFALLMLSFQPIFSKSVLNTENLIKKMNNTLDTIEKVHKDNIDLLRPFSKEKSQAEDETIEKKIHHKVRKMSREPGFLKSFFLTECAEQDVRCPFLWYFRQVVKSANRANRQRKNGISKLKRLKKMAASVKTSAVDVKNCNKFIEEIEELNKDLEDTEGGLLILKKFIKESDSYSKELQTQKSLAAKPNSHFINMLDIFSGNSRRY